MAIQSSTHHPRPTPKAHPSDRFKRADTPPKPRLLLSIYGDTKTGKSNFSLTAPGPIGDINIDLGLDGVVQKFQTEKEVFVSQYRLKIPPKGSDIEKVAAASTEVWDNILEDYYYSLDNYRTTIIDTGDEAHVILRLARLGKLTQVMPHHYGPVNAEWRDLWRAADSSDGNLIVTHKVKAEYVNDKKTGKMERAGFADDGFLAQVEIRTYRIPWDEREEGDNGFRAEIMSCRHNPEIEGEVLQGPMLNFPWLATMVMPDTSLEDWG